MKKFLLTLGACAMAFGAFAAEVETTVVWTGSYDITWEWDKSLEIAADQLTSLVAGDNLVFTVSNVDQNAGWPQICLQDNAHSSLVNVGLSKNAATPFTAEINIPYCNYPSSLIDTVKKGIFIAGDGGTISQIAIAHTGDASVEMPAGTLWMNPDGLALSWSSGSVIFESSVVETLEVGQSINITAISVASGDNVWPQVHLKNGSWATIAQIDFFGESYNGKTPPFTGSIELTEEILEALAGGQMIIQGDGATISLITVSGIEDEPSSEEVVASFYTGNGKTAGYVNPKDNVDANYDLNGSPCLMFTNETALSQGDNWKIQALFTNVDFEAGMTYTFTFDYIGDACDNIVAFIQYNGGSYPAKSRYLSVSLPQATEWTQVSFDLLCSNDDPENEPANSFGFNLGQFEGTGYITNLVVTTPKETEEPGDKPGTDTPGFTAPEGYEVVISGDTADGVSIVKWNNAFENTEVDGVECISYTNEAAVSSYDRQLAFDYNFEPEEMYYIVFDVKGDASDVNISAWYQYKSSYTALGYSDFNSFQVTSDTEWYQVVLEGKYTEKDDMTADRVVLNLGEYVGTLYMTNFKVYGPEPKTDGVKAIETINNAPKGVYNLQGVKVGENLDGLKKGIYIVNGKKVLVK